MSAIWTTFEQMDKKFDEIRVLCPAACLSLTELMMIMT